MLSLNPSLVLDRRFSLFSKDYIQTLELFLYYVIYVAPEFSTHIMFYRSSVRRKTRTIRDRTAIYSHNQRVVYTRSQSSRQAVYSDVMVGFSFNLGIGYSTEQTLQYNQGTNRLVHANIEFMWRLVERLVFNATLYYRYENIKLFYKLINQLMVSVRCPLVRRLYGVFRRMNYSII
ncbi:LPS assembly protein LptD [Candidatus Vallotia lariciata]|uniref:LPS assembly protein LptD n=1 Tax=Candidatus Vallotia laricis TaxID=2018052 RepID=UPI003B969CCB|nr:LPS-assembly protein LptD [Candidatus Vallotia lariciata]